MSLSSKTARDLRTYALVGAIATPIALVGGEVLAAVFCILTIMAVGIARQRGR